MHREINDVFYAKNNLYNHIAMDLPERVMEDGEIVPNPYLYDITFSDYKWSIEEVKLKDGSMWYLLQEHGECDNLPCAEGQNYGDCFDIKLVGDGYAYLLDVDDNQWVVLKNDKEVNDVQV